MRPSYHYTPPVGWMNDPNGLVHHGGVHHLYYQHNPDATTFGLMRWGHATSRDLLTWTDRPTAMSPGPEAFDVDGCFSGCAVPVDGRVAFLYTGVRGEAQLPCLAWGEGEDLSVLVKDRHSPVVARRPPVPGLTDFRDNSVERTVRGWRQYVGGGGGPAGGVIGLYTGDDLTTWRYHGVFADAASCDVPGVIWECPDVFRFGDTVVVIVSVMYAGPEREVWWIVGRDTDGRLTPTASGRLDLGDTLYAPQSYWARDGRRLMIGWLRTHLDPATAHSSYVGAMSLPMELSVVDGRLHARPARELGSLRPTPLSGGGTAGTAGGEVGPGGTRLRLGADGATAWRLRAPVATDGQLELRFVDAAGIAARPVTLRGPGASDGTGVSDVSGGVGPGVVQAEVFFDAGIVEAFVDGRLFAWSRLGVPRVSIIELAGLPPEGPAPDLRILRIPGDTAPG